MFFQISKKKEPLSGLVSFSWWKFQEKILREVCVCLCVREQYCTKQGRLLTIRIIWGKTEKDFSLPFKGPHNCLPHILSVQPKFLHVHLCERGAESALGFMCRQAAVPVPCQASVQRCCGKVWVFPLLHLIFTARHYDYRRTKILGRWAPCGEVPPGGAVP